MRSPEKVQDFVILNMLETLLTKHGSYIRHCDILQDKVNTIPLKTSVNLGKFITRYSSIFKKSEKEKHGTCNKVHGA